MTGTMKKTNKSLNCAHLQDERISQELVMQDDATYDVPGCCGGGCNIISGLKYCPFCGERL